MKQDRLLFESLESKKLLSSNSIVAIIDSGAEIGHPYLRDHLWTNRGEIAGDNIDNDGNGYIDDIHGWNFVENNNNLNDGYGHGTSVAGLIVANQHTDIMVLRFQNNSGLGFTGEAIAAINYVNNMKEKYGVDVVAINASYGATPGYSSLEYQAINRARSNGILFVAAAGNSSNDNDYYPRYPSTYNLDNIVAVAALGENNYLTSYSNYGKNSVDIAAYANGVNTSALNNSYSYFAGTSCAAPRVSSAIGFVKYQHNDWNIQQIKDYIFSKAEKFSSLENKVLTGGKLSGDLTFSVNERAVVAITPVTIKAASVPYVMVQKVSRSRIAGWAFNEDSGKKAVTISIEINDIYVKNVISNQYRYGLKKLVGSSYHGFNVKLASKWLVKGENVIRIRIGNHEAWSGKIYK